VTVGDWLIVIALVAAIWRLGDLVALGRKMAAELAAGGAERVTIDVQNLGKQVDHVGVAVMDLNRDVANLQREMAELNRAIGRLTTDISKLAQHTEGADVDPETAAAIRELAALAKDIDRR
jgi:predicted  nucleic acid-binding Zn-ribbon protein